MAKKAKSAKKVVSSKSSATKKKTSGKFSILNELNEQFMKIATVSRSGEVKVKRAELKTVIENVFQQAAVKAAGGERVRFPVIGVLVRREVKARKAGKGVNPFTGEPTMIKARPASQKPRWSFPKVVKETFANKKFW